MKSLKIQRGAARFVRRGGCFQHTATPNRNGSDKDRVMAPKAVPSPEVLRQLLRYEPETGKLFWRERNSDMFSNSKQPAGQNAAIWNAKFAGKEAFTHVQKGYRTGRVFDSLYRAHRVIFAMMTGAWPDDQVDHINHDRSDNRWSNLRSASNSENHKNMSLRADNASGVAGVSWCPRRSLWRSRIHVSGHDRHLGYFADKHQAIAARANAVESFGFHENHGNGR